MVAQGAGDDATAGQVQTLGGLIQHNDAGFQKQYLGQGSSLLLTAA